MHDIQYSFSFLTIFFFFFFLNKQHQAYPGLNPKLATIILLSNFLHFYLKKTNTFTSDFRKEHLS